MPRPSCESGTSHAPKQNRRVAAGLNAAYNPFWKMLNPQRIGLAGHSFGAAGVSYVGQKDPRVSAIVAWDNLGRPGTSGGLPVKPCPADPASHAAAPITKPALGMSADYGLTAHAVHVRPGPAGQEPGRRSPTRRRASTRASSIDPRRHALRVQLHPEPGLRRNAARRRPGRLVHDRLVRQVREGRRERRQAPVDDALAERRAPRPRSTRTTTATMFSFYYRSRFDFGRASGGRFTCEDMRTGCAGMSSNDGRTGSYSYLDVANSPDR